MFYAGSDMLGGAIVDCREGIPMTFFFLYPYTRTDGARNKGYRNTIFQRSLLRLGSVTMCEQLKE